MKAGEDESGINESGSPPYKKTLLYFVAGYLVFALFGAYSFLGRLAAGMGEATGPAFTADQLAILYFFIFFGFLTAVLSQVSFWLIKPRRKSKEKQGSSSLYLPSIVLLVVLALIDYLVRVGAYFAGENAYWGETYPKGTLLYTLDSVFRQINGPISLMFLILGPVYALWLFVRFLRIRSDR